MTAKAKLFKCLGFTMTAFFSTPIVFAKPATLFHQEFSKAADNLAQKFNAPLIYSKDISDRQNVIYLDAREVQEYTQSHIPGAIHVGYKTFNLERTLALLKEKGLHSQIVVYCSMGYRSGDIAQRLRDRKIPAFNLWGGIFDWHNQGFSLEKDDDVNTLSVHPYSSKWKKWLKPKPK